VVSILVPVYNSERYLKRCIDSILAQTFKEFELILMDDGSTDKSAEICDLYAGYDNRIRVFHNKNEGVGATRNLLLNNARGNYISFVDSDDFIEPEMIEVLLSNLHEYDADISICGTNIVGKSKQSKLKAECRVLSKKQAIFELIDNRNVTHSVWDKLYKAKLFEDIRFAEIPAFEDMLTIYKLLEKCDKVVLDSRKLYNYVSTLGSLMRKKFNIYHLAELKAQSDLMEHIGTAYPDMLPKLKIRELNTKLFVCGRILSESPEMSQLYNEMSKEIKDNYKEIMLSKYADKKTKFLATLMKISDNVYKLIIRIINSNRRRKRY